MIHTEAGGESAATVTDFRARSESFANRRRRDAQLRRIVLCSLLILAFATSGRTETCSNRTTTQLQVQCLEGLLKKKADSDSVFTKDQLRPTLQNLNESVNRKAERSELDAKADRTSLENQQKLLSFNIDRFWVLLAALLVFFMQAGFKCLEVGMVDTKFDTLQAAYKLFSWIATYAGYFFSFAVMFAGSRFGLFGWHLPIWPSAVIEQLNSARGIEFFLFQAAFAATAVTIPSGAAAERMSLRGYFFTGLFIAFLVYPVFGHWAWGGSLFTARDVAANPELQGWLRRLGFHDFAGSTVVHSIGGWFALAAAQALGPRRRRFFQDGTVNVEDFPVRSRGYAVLGVFMLWFGWWGFNGGSQLKYDPSIAGIILNTNIAAAAAGVTAWCTAYWHPWFKPYPWFKPGFIAEKTIGGILGGLVAITASCYVATPLLALIVGILAGVWHNLVFDWLLHHRIDDPVGAFPVHTGCGMLGTFLVAFASGHEALTGSVASQALAQICGIAAAFAFAYTLARGWFAFLAWGKWLSYSDGEGWVIKHAEPAPAAVAANA